MEIRLTRQSVASPLFLALFDEAVALHLAADVEPGDSELEEQIKRQRQITHLSELIKQLSDMLEYVYAVSDFDDINDEHGD